MEYRAGDAIHSLKQPLVRYLSAANKKLRCNYCFQCMDLMPHCSSCKMVSYCGNTCQRRDWKSGHSIECKLYSLIPELTSNDMMGKVVRFISWFKVSDKIQFSESSRFTSIEDYIKSIRYKARNLSSFARYLADTMLFTTTECDFDSIVRALAVRKWNGVIVPSENNSGDLGTVLYMINTTFSHSYSSLSMQIPCIDGISGGQPVTIRRIPDISRRNLRRRILQNQLKT